MYGYGGYGMGYGWFDPTMILLLIGMALSMLASAKVQSTFAAYSRVRSRRLSGSCAPRGSTTCAWAMCGAI